MVNQTIQVGKKYAVYLPKKIAEAMGVKEGDILLAQLKGRELTLKRVEAGLKTAKAWSKIKPEEVEEVGEEITKNMLE